MASAQAPAAAAVTIQVIHGRKTHDVRLPATATLRDLKEALTAITGLGSERMRFSGLYPRSAGIPSDESLLSRWVDAGAASPRRVMLMGGSSSTSASPAPRAASGQGEGEKEQRQRHHRHRSHSSTRRRRSQSKSPKQGSGEGRSRRRASSSSSSRRRREREQTDAALALALSQAEVASDDGSATIDPAAVPDLVTGSPPRLRRRQGRSASRSQSPPGSSASLFGGLGAFGAFGSAAARVSGGQLNQDDLMRLMDSAVHGKELAATWDVQYGPMHPIFLECSLRDAIRLAGREFKPLIVYLHAPEQDAAASFARDVLGASAVAEYINEHFLFWAGDVSNLSTAELTNQLGVREFPYFAVVARLFGSMTVLEIAQGAVSSADAFLSRMMGVVENHAPLLASLKEESAARQATTNMIAEQDEEFAKSLAADRAKEAKAAAEREAAEAAAAAAAAAEAERVAEIERKRQARIAKGSRLPPQPSATAKEVARVVIKLPDGSRIQRRFKPSTKLQAVFDFVDSQGYPFERFTLSTNYPRRVYTDPNQTLQAAGLVPQAMLFLTVDGEQASLP